MIPKECKRLAEVDFPIAVVSKHSAREKSIRHGHPSTLHLWWARRPLAACRAMLMALLLPDPSDTACPQAFKDDARKILLAFPGRPEKWDRDLKKDEGLRAALLKFIGDFANWDVAADRDYLRTARALVKAAHGDEPPLVVDPFAGGGSIPLEALRIGCDAFASDLNPVACLILKTMLEDIPRHGPGLADELRRVGAEIKKAAERELAEFYPEDPDRARPIAYLWARTVRCESSGCGAEIPLVRSFWLCKKASRKRALRYEVVKHRGLPPQIEFEVFTPRSDRQIPQGTVTRAKATCPACKTVLPPERVRAQLHAQRGGADVQFDAKGRRTGGARLLAVVTLHPKKDGRQYRVATDRDCEAVWKAMRRLEKVAAQKLPNGLSPVPDEPLPPVGTLGFRVQRYGMLQWGDLFTARQKLALGTFASKTARLTPPGFPPGMLGQNVSHVVDRNSSLCRWRPQSYMETVEGVFGRQALPVVWDFAEAALLSESTGSYSHALGVVSLCVEGNAGRWRPGTAQSADAINSPHPDDSADVWFTDPPYYDAVPYSDLSDFFFVWLRRSLAGSGVAVASLGFGHELTPKVNEIVQDETREFQGRPKDRSFFESAMARAFAEGRRVLDDTGIGAVVFAHKTTEGWEALLGGLIRGGWTLTGSWPVSTEMGTRLRARESAALATSVHLVCRPRPDIAGVGDWGDVYRELPGRVGDWMDHLSAEGVRGADLVFACIGPAMEIYSRYARVEDAQGREIPLGGDPEAVEPYRRGFLAYVWETVGRIALQQILGTAEARARNGTAAALEEDARLTALFLWTVQSTTATDNGAGEGEEDDANTEEEDEDDDATEGGGRRGKGLTLVYDVVRRFAQPLGIHLDQWDGRVIGIHKGVVRLIPVAERAEQLFGEEGAEAVAGKIEAGARRGREMSFDFMFDREEEPPRVKDRAAKGRKPSAREVSDDDLAARRGATTLDRVHAAMLLQAAGRANALREVLKVEQDRGPDFLRLANALSALYPKDSEEKRLLDAMLLAVPR